LSLKIQDYAEKYKIDVRELLKKTVRTWLDDGLFVTEYAPIWNSTDKVTCNDESTKLPHKEILKRWLKTKAEARTKVQKLIDDGQLEVEIRYKELFGVRDTIKIITGKSLYNLGGDFAFALDFKKQVENLKSFGSLVLFLRDRSFLKGYASLLAFAEIYKKLSAVYEIDLGYKIDEFILDFKISIEQLNKELRFIADKLQEAIYHDNNIKFLVEIVLDDMLMNLEEIEPGTDETETFYSKELEKIFRNPLY